MWPFLYDHDTRLCTISGIHNQGPRHLRKSKVGGGDRFHQGNCLSHVAGCPDCGHGPFPESVIHSFTTKARLLSLTRPYNKNACIFAILH